MNHPARNTDIGTSHAAANFIAASGIQKDQQAKAAAAVKLHPGLTSMKLAQVTGLDRYMLARRLPELLKTEQVWRRPRNRGMHRAQVMRPMQGVRPVQWGMRPVQGVRQRAQVWRCAPCRLTVI